MNIRLLTSFFLPDSVGGGETHTLHLARALKARGHDVRIWRTATATAVREDYEYQGIPVELAPTEGTREHDRSVSSAWLARCVRQQRIAVVHVTISGRCQAMMAAVAAAGVPMVVTFLDFHYWCSRALQHADGRLCPGPETVAGCHQCLVKSSGRVHYLAPFWRRLPRALQGVTARLPRLNTLELAARQIADQAADFRFLVDAGSMFVAPSPIMRRLAEQAGVAPDRIVDLPYGVPSEFVGAAREKLPSATLRVGFFGRLVPEKGVDVLLQAVTSLPRHLPMELSLYGAAPPEADAYRARLDAMAALDPRIHFRGTVDQSRLPEIHRHLDVIALPSLWHENATIVLLESRALGTPVLVSEVEGMAPFVDPGRNGFTFPVGDAAALSRRLAWCVEHRETLQDMARQCRPALTTEEHAARIEAVYEGLERSRRTITRQASPAAARPR